ncbi:hypothetical protein D9758_001503 [Tetrapyrgos nigripes]|uniref:FAD-binding domain-containing protein n=1 Tax=Tetrapyrgos nigripes TaxID=182062 RepID=A0A8H5LXE0_9AGAR|nr:hypothetical protein D9758_001503 [Tetrapyrgos nigripes]
MKDRVLIIGAGPVGLLIAQTLKKLGIPFGVFEQAASVDARPRDWSFGVYWAQTPLAECLPEGIDEKFLVENAQVDDLKPTADFVLPFFNSETGDLLKEVPIPFSIRFAKRKFVGILSQGVDICYGKRLAEVKTEADVVTAVFEDGIKEEGKLLIGCDGAHSKVRDFLLGPESAALKPLPFLSSVVLASVSKETALAIREVHPRNVSVISPSGTFGWISIHDCHDPDPAKWIFMYIMTWPEAQAEEDLDASDRPDIVQVMKEKSEGFAEPLKSLFQAIPDDALLAWHNRLSNWPTEKWDNKNGKVTLAGDAAHPMTFHRGQGLNNAISDAYTLMCALQEHYLPSGAGPFVEALKIYEDDVWKRGREAVVSNEENTIMLHDWEKFTQSPLFNIGVAKSVADQEAR